MSCGRPKNGSGTTLSAGDPSKYSSASQDLEPRFPPWPSPEERESVLTWTCHSRISGFVSTLLQDGGNRKMAKDELYSDFFRCTVICPVFSRMAWWTSLAHEQPAARRAAFSS